MRAWIGGAALFVAGWGAAMGGEIELAQAQALRAETGADWEAGRFDEAAEKLRRADAIYAAEPGDHVADRAVVLRALCFHLWKAGRTEDLIEAWKQLAGLGAERAEVGTELRQAYATPIFQTARSLPHLEARSAFLEPLRATALEAGHAHLAAQILHDLGWFSFEDGAVEEAAGHYREAVAERGALGDLDGLAWSQNNLANALLELGREEEALPHLQAAWKLVHERGRLQTQATTAVVLRKLLRRHDDPARMPAAVREWLWQLGESAAASRVGQVVPPEHLLRLAFRAAPDLDAAQRLAEATLAARPPEARADLLLRAVRAAVDGGEVDTARTWLERVDVGEGPAAAHLEGRRRLMLALVEARSGRADAFAAAATSAADRFRELGDREGRESALAELVEGARTVGEPAEALGAALRVELDELRRSGRPGGAGGSASSGGDRSLARELVLHEPLFEIRWSGEELVVQDLVADRTTTVPVTWSPRAIGLNGLVVTLFGGYARIDSLDYGSSTVVPGAPGTTTLDALGEYLPVPAQGRLLVLCNGAHRYED